MSFEAEVVMHLPKVLNLARVIYTSKRDLDSKI